MGMQWGDTGTQNPSGIPPSNLPSHRGRHVTHHVGVVGEGGVAQGGRGPRGVGQALPKLLGQKRGERGQEPQPQIRTRQQRHPHVLDTQTRLRRLLRTDRRTQGQGRMDGWIWGQGWTNGWIWGQGWMGEWIWGGEGDLGTDGQTDTVGLMGM